MSRRIPSCINFDPENLDYLRQRPEGMAEFLNTVIGGLRGEQTIKNVELKERVEKVVENVEKQKVDDTVKIRAYFKDAPHIIYMAKTQRKFNKSDLCRIKEELFFSKYNVDATIQEIRKVLKDEIDQFDVENYEKERGIFKKR